MVGSVVWFLELSEGEAKVCKDFGDNSRTCTTELEEKEEKK